MGVCAPVCVCAYMHVNECMWALTCVCACEKGEWGRCVRACVRAQERAGEGMHARACMSVAAIRGRLCNSRPLGSRITLPLAQGPRYCVCACLPACVWDRLMAVSASSKCRWVGDTCSQRVKLVHGTKGGLLQACPDVVL